MLWLVLVCSVVVVVLVAWLVVKERQASKDRDAVLRRALDQALQVVASDTSAAQVDAFLSQRRLEVMVVDWAKDDETYLGSPMRFRWSVWDASRYFQAEPGPDAGLKMLGNAPTQAEARAQVMAWVTQWFLDADEPLRVLVSEPHPVQPVQPVQEVAP